MKKIESFVKSGMMVLALVAGLFLVSCDDTPEEIIVDKSELSAAITTAENLLETAVEGTANGQFQQGSKAVLQEVIDLAKTVVADETVTQSIVDNTVVAVEQAVSEFEGKVVEPIAPEALVLHYTFDEGTGTTVEDFSGNSFGGEFRTGHEFYGAGNATWTTDRYGNENKALHFDQGSHIEVPYNAALNPENISISLWIKADVLESPWANNYMISLNQWNAYKLQLQDANKVFFTVKALNEGEEAWYDRDNESPTITQGEWYHIAVCYGGGKMNFYFDGTLVKSWENTPGTAIALSDAVNLTIGQSLPNGGYNEDNKVEWGGYFRGIMDEIRIFNTVLTDTQVQSIYDLEKVSE